MVRGTGGKIAAGVAVLASLFALILSAARAPKERLRAKVRQLVRDASPFNVGTSDHAKPLKLLDQMGAAADPFLAEMLLSRSNPLERFFNSRVRPSLPIFVSSRLPPATTKAEAQMDAALAVARMGPITARRLEPALVKAFPLADWSAQIQIADSLRWSALESPDAQSALASFVSRWFAERRIWMNPPNLELFTALTNVPPELIQNGLSAVLSNDFWRGIRIPEFASRVAATSFDSIVVRSQLVSRARGVTNNSDPKTRLPAIMLLARLGACPKGELLDALTNLAANEEETKLELEELAEMGVAAHEALPWIDGFISAAPPKASPIPGKPIPDWLRLKAIFAACRVAPEQAARFGPELVSRIERNPEAVDFLIEFTPCDSAVIENLAASLSDRPLSAIISAAIVLAHNSGETNALSALRVYLADGAPNQQLDAAYWLWRFTGDAEPFLSRAPAAAGSPVLLTRFETCRRLGEMGPIARKAAPALQTALHFPDFATREYAGRALMRVAPELMPPIGEGK